ncbi:hypothetical protein DY000_02036441 [Brassica cretica]|uniref:Uncharacterized protein n=1 Tax=Brassica cretica TaxID=69181 RepID=A0ABQ7BRV4_BRACR|nr:hypothetical protein DY000_02036441 [Brassica cretica]
MVEATSNLTPTQRYAAGALFAIALNQAQINQTQPLGIPAAIDDDDDKECDRSEERRSNCSSGDSVSDDPNLWVHETSGLLRPVFRCLDIDSSAWLGLEETANSSPAKHHIGAFTRLLSEEASEASVEMVEQEMALAKAADAMVHSIRSSLSIDAKKEKHQEYENECREKYAVPEVKSKAVEKDKEESEAAAERESLEAGVVIRDGSHNPDVVEDDKSVEDVHNQGRLAVEVLVAGVVFEEEDFVKPWQGLTSSLERYTLQWESKNLILVSTAIQDWLTSRLAMELMKQGAMHTVLSSLLLALAWPATILVAADFIDSKWSIAIDRSDKAGKLLAEVLQKGLQGNRPITLVGFSLGARVIFKCLQTLAETEQNAELVERVVILGAPISINNENWRDVRKRLAVEVLVAGVVFEEEDFVKPWQGSTSSLERYTLQWESKNLILVSTAIQDWLTSRLAMELMKQGAMHTVLSSLLLALAWPATILVAADFIDSKWSIAIDRSDKAGKLLAEVLQKGLQGNRPITLVGFSLGARVIFKCLQTLAETEQNAELVERVVILGAPISINNENWRDVRKMVAGRFINVYATNDWTLGVAFRARM